MKLLLSLIFLSNFSHADALDRKLQGYINQFRLKAIEKPRGFNEVKFELGKELFNEVEVSGNRNMSCATCHDPGLGTSDGLPLPIGVAGSGIGPKRVANGAPTIPRNAPHLFNLHDVSFMFWDGRVKFDNWEFTTPEPGLNGDYPELYEITEELGSALAAQALFPPTSFAEMRGSNNELADAKSNVEVWNRIMKRLLKMPKYKKLFKSSYPNAKSFNIGHFGNALAHFQSHEFSVTQTPWDNYLRGNKSALSLKEKRGALVFFESGKCINCHSGSQLGGSEFHNIASPQIGPGKDVRKNDEGRFLVTKRRADLYNFKTPSLRNTVKTAPYFHSGVYQTLEEVLTHYNRGLRAIDEYSSNWLMDFEVNNYGSALFVETNNYMLFKKKENAHPLMRKHEINMTMPEKDDLLKFLEVSLTQD